LRSCDKEVDVVTRLRVDSPGSKSLQGRGRFLFSTMSRKHLQPTTLPMQWLMEFLAGC